MKWFKHDSNAHSDAKLEKVLMRYGADGYALYWYCIELIAGKIDVNNFNFELEHDAELLGFKLKIDSLRVEEIMRYMINLGLFENSGETITCMKLAKRLDQSMTGNPGMRQLISKSHDTVMTQSLQNRIDKKRIEKNNSRFAPPSLKEVSEYCQERGNSVDPEAFINYYEASRWMRGKTKIKDWKACVRTWEKNTKTDLGTIE